MNYTWKSAEDSNVQGTIEIRLPKYTERLKYLRDCQFEINEAGEVEVSNGMLDSTIKMIEIAEKHVEKVDLVNEMSQEIKSFEQMEYHPECELILQELGQIMLNGVQLGNDSNPT